MTRLILANESDLRTPPTTKATNYTIALADEGLMLDPGAAAAGAVTYTLPDDVTVPFPIGGFVDVYRNSSATNAVTVACAAGVTLRLRGDSTATSYSLYRCELVRLVKLSATAWLVLPLAGPQDAVPWTAVTYLNAYTTPAGYLGVGYRKIGDTVELRGTCSGTFAASQSMFQLPVGFRPPGRLVLPGNTTDGTAFGRVDIMADGNVTRVTGTWPTGANSYVAFTGVSFSLTA